MTTVRAASPVDLDGVASLEARAFVGTAEGAWSPRSVEEEFASLGDTRRIVVAVEDRAVVGHAVLMTVGSGGDLTRVAVDPSRRRLGIASRLIESVIADARAVGLDAVMLEVADGNAGAIALYERHGFQIVDRRAAYYPDGSDALVMRKGLSSRDTADTADTADASDTAETKS